MLSKHGRDSSWSLSFIILTYFILYTFWHAYSGFSKKCELSRTTYNFLSCIYDFALFGGHLISWPTLLTNNEYIIDEIRITFTHCYYKNIYHPYFKTFDNIKTIINETIEIGFNFISLKLIFHFSFSFLHKNTH